MEILEKPQLRKKGFDILLKELGAVGFVEFLRDIGLQQTDYTSNRQSYQEDIPLDTLITQINEIEAKYNAN